MSGELNKESKEGLTREIKNLQERCLDSYNIIENSLIDAGISKNNIYQKALKYVDGLREEIHNSNTPIVNDDNLIISQFLAESKQRLTQVEELTAFTKGAISEIDFEISRLKNLNEIAQEAMSRPKVVPHTVNAEHIVKAKETFHTLKTELHGLIQSFFPNSSSIIMDVMSQLIKEKLNEESNGYIQITQENYDIIGLLQDMSIVSLNPYNNMECKIAY